jgi:hypothetical protein
MGSIVNMNNDFSKEVEEFVKKQKEPSYIDAVLHLCEKHGVEPDTISKLLSKPIKERLKVEGQQLNLLKRDSKLPL